jgi:hypothetical protein
VLTLTKESGLKPQKSSGNESGQAIISGIFTDNLNCRGQFLPLHSVRKALDQVHATLRTVKELTVLNGSDRTLAFIPARATKGDLMVWDYPTGKFVGSVANSTYRHLSALFSVVASALSR